ncbi:hypothetical protein [Haliea sp. E17]|uniref:hypothetical protein n=1 Tax=Haliea sp. E17 TaxID=3401576 RepID=UPI003AAA6339
MSRDDIDHIPSIVPSRDRDDDIPAGKPRGSAPPPRSPKGGASRPAPAPRGGSGLMSRLVLTVTVVAAAVACAWAWQLQQELQSAQGTLEQYANRIADLEDRLSDTDEGMSQNAAVQAAKIKELDSEVRKLWDNVWKQTKARLDTLESTGKKQATLAAANEKAVKSLQSKVSGAEEDLKKLKTVSGDLSRLASSAKSSQAEVERVADAMNKLELDLAKLNRQVDSNAEGLRATDAFRRQANTSISNLEAAIRELQARPSL